MAITYRGFAAMDRTRQREIASKAGKAAHLKGTAHEWSSKEARDAGSRGGMASHRRRQEVAQDSMPQNHSVEGTNPDADASRLARLTSDRSARRR